ncbi:MAG TPA: phosphotransferase [Patescibacteria group bacterium]|nr:phosphotransferase [Patescibacteria group bacterium]
MDDFFSRVDSRTPLPDLLKHVAERFELGTVNHYEPILTGYQECNIDLTTTNGRYVVKIFSKEKTKLRIDDIIWGYMHLKKDIPLPVIKPTKDGHHVLEIPGPSYLCVFDYFEGKPLTQTPITDADLSSLTLSLSSLHKNPKTIDHYYDTMGIVNVAREYALKKDALFPDEQSLIEPVITKLQRIKLSSFRQSIIHGSMEKENVLKNSAGELCILDLGCMDYNASILDIATFIANFTVYLNEEKRKNFTELILTTYQQSHPLTRDELTALPTLIRAQYVAYIIVMTHKMRKLHDMTKQTQTWLDRGWGGLKKSL